MGVGTVYIHFLKWSFANCTKTTITHQEKNVIYKMLEIHDGLTMWTPLMGIQKHYEDTRLVSQQKISSV